MAFHRGGQHPACSSTASAGRRSSGGAFVDVLLREDLQRGGRVLLPAAAVRGRGRREEVPPEELASLTVAPAPDPPSAGSCFLSRRSSLRPAPSHSRGTPWARTFARPSRSDAAPPGPPPRSPEQLAAAVALPSRSDASTRSRSNLRAACLRPPHTRIPPRCRPRSIRCPRHASAGLHEPQQPSFFFEKPECRTDTLLLWVPLVSERNITDVDGMAMREVQI